MTGQRSGRGLLILVAVDAAEALAAFPEYGTGEWNRRNVARLRRAGARSTHPRIAVVGRSMAELRRVLPFLARGGNTDTATFAVLCGERADLLRVPTVDPRFGVRAAACSRAPRRGPASVTVRTTAAVPLLSVARAVLGAPPVAGAMLPGAGLRLGAAATPALAWLAGDPTARFVDDRVPLHDPVIGAVFDAVVGPAPAGAEGAADPVPRIDMDADALPPVDTAVISPRGFRRDADAPPATIVVRPGLPGGTATFLMRDATGAEIARGDLRAGLTERHIAALRAHRWVRVADDGCADPMTSGRLLSQLACAGVPTLASAGGPTLRRALGPLAARFAVSEENFADPEAREDWSVTTRRLALGRFAAPCYWSAVSARIGRPATALPAVSVLLLCRTANRVPFALAQVARQDWAAVHTVLVLHGVAADHPDVRSAVLSFDRAVEVIESDAAQPPGRALAEGLSRCSGRLVATMTDTHWYGPHHLTDLVLARLHSGADVVGLSAFHAYLPLSDVTERRPGAVEAPTAWLHPDTVLMATEDAVTVGDPRGCAGATRYGIHDLGFLARGRSTDGRAPGEPSAPAPARRTGFVPPPQLWPLRAPQGCDVIRDTARALSRGSSAAR